MLMECLKDLALLTAGAVLLYYGAEFLVKGGVRIAETLGVSPLVIGLTLIAAATSAPEAVVSINAALQGEGGISIGNVIGSNICNIALILGLCSLISPLTVDRDLLRSDVPVMAGATVLFLTVYFCGNGISRPAAAFFFILFLLYEYWTVSREKRKVRAGGSLPDGTPAPAAASTNRTGASVLILALLTALFGLAVLVAGSKIFLLGAIGTAEIAGLSKTVIGLTIVAVGTSLPELATSVVAAIRGKADIATGNIVGSNIFNILLILGVAPMFRPVRNAGITAIDGAALLLCTFLLIPFMITGLRISRGEGAVLLLLYSGYLASLVCTAAL